jgi:hypothetical protein
MTVPYVRSAAFFVLLTGLTGLSAVAQSGGTGTDAFSVRRVTLSGERLASALKEAEEGSLIRMLPAEFDRLLVQARSDSPSQHPTPAAIEGRYRAKFTADPDGAGSLQGTAELLLRRPSNASPVLALDGLQLAIRQAKWSDGKDAVLYKMPGDPHPSLYVPEGESRTLNLEWTAGGIPEPGETRFELRVPIVPIASLELELPVGVVPVLPQEEALLTGPSPSGPGEAVWKIAFGGISRLELVLRRAGENPDVLFTRLLTTQTLTGSGGTARYEFQVESPRVGFTELVFGHDSGFQPTGVRVNNLVSWTTTGGGSQPPGVVVRLREPTRSAVVVLTGTLATTPAGKLWVSPGVWVKSAVQRSERLKIVLSPTCRIRDWNPNGSRLILSELGPDQFYTLDLERVAPGRPTLEVVPRSTDSWTATQRADWRLGRDGETLVVKTTLQVTNTPPRAIRFPLSLDWQVERVNLGPAEAIWTVTDRDPRTLEVELSPADRAPAITISMRRTTRLPRREVPIPDLLPEGCSSRTGTLTISAESGLEMFPSEQFPELSPRASSSTEELVRTLASEPLTGWVTVRARPSRSRIEIRSEIQSGRAGAAIHTALTVTPEGPVTNINLWTAGPVKEPWEWRDEQGRYVAAAVRVPEADARPWLLGMVPTQQFATASTFAGVAASSGCRWRIRLPRPADRPIALYSDYQCGAPEQSRVSPVPWAFGGQFHGVVSLASDTPAEIIDSRWVPTTSRVGTERTYHYGTGISRSPAVYADAIRPDIEALRLVTTIDAEGNCRCTFQLRVRRWAKATLPLHLPTEARDVRVSVAGRSVSLDPEPNAALNVPLPASESWTLVRIEYCLPRVTGLFVVDLPRKLPSGPFNADAVRCIWHLSPEWGLTGGEGFYVAPGNRSSPPPLPLPGLRKLRDLVGWSRLSAASVTPGPRDNIANALSQSFPGQYVIVDTDAAACARLLPSASADGDPLKAAGLVAVQLPACVLVGRPEDVNRWHLNASWRGTLDAAVAAAIDEAARTGADASGRFRTVANWANSREETDTVIAPAGWLVLEADGTVAAVPRVYRRELFEALSWIGVAIFGLAVLALVRGVRGRLLLLTVVCGVATLISVFGPASSAWIVVPFLLVSVVTALVSARRGRLTGNLPRPTEHEKLSGAATLAVLIAAVGIAHAAPVPPTEVVQVTDKDGNVTAVLVPRELVEKLHTRGRPVPPAVVTAASYVGTADGGTARFSVRYQLFSFRDQATALRVPLAGVRFRSVALDGAEAREIDAPADGLQVTLTGKGVHTLEVDFAVPVAGSGAERDVKFSIPEVPISKVEFELPGTVNRLRTGAWRGAVRTNVSPKSTTLEADIGPSSVVSLRWPGGDDRNSAVRSNEAWVWQVGPASATLIGAIEFQVSGRPVSECRIALPARTEVCRLSVAGDAPVAGAQPPRTKDWQITPADGPGPRQLRVELLQPVSGRFAVQVEMASTAPIADRLSLQLPRALGTAEANAVAAIEFQGVSDPADFEADGWTEVSVPALLDSVKNTFADTSFLGMPSRGFRAVRATPGAVSFPIRLASPISTVTETATWCVDPARIAGIAESHWNGSAVSFLEWSLPATLIVNEVSGRNVVSWSQSGGHIQAWLDRPVSDVSVSWRASRPRSPAEGKTAPIPAVRYASVNTANLVRRVRSRNGWLLAPGRGGLPKEPLAPQFPGEVAWRCAADADVEFELLPPQRESALDIRAAIDLHADRVHSTHSIDLRALDAARPHVLSVFVTANRDDEVQLSAPPAFVIRDDGNKKAAVRRWDISIPLGRPADSSLAVEVSSSPGALGSWRLPRVDVRFGGDQEPILSETVAVKSDAITLADVSGLERVGTSQWRVIRRPRQATVTRSAGLRHGELIRVTGARASAGRIGRTWDFRCECTLAYTGPTVLTVGASTGARLRAVELDGAAVGISDEKTANVYLPGESGSGTLRLEWSANELTVGPPEIRVGGAPVPLGDVEFVVYVPPGFGINTSGAGIRETVDSRPPSNISTDRPFRGTPRHYRLAAGQSLDVQFISEQPRLLTWQHILLAGLWLATLLLAMSGAPETAGCLAVIAVLVIGPTAAALLLIPAAILAWRIWRLPGVFAARSAGREARVGTL